VLRIKNKNTLPKEEAFLVILPLPTGEGLGRGFFLLLVRGGRRGL